MMLFPLLASFSIVASQPTDEPFDSAAERIVSIQDEFVRVSDVADLTGLDAAATSRTKDLVVARLPKGVSELVLTREEAAALLHRRVPGLGLRHVRGSGSLSFRRAQTVLPAGMRKESSKEEPGVTPCWSLARAVHTGAAMSAAEMTKTPCMAGEIAAPVRYDRRYGALRAGADLPAGSYLGRIDLPEVPMVPPGEMVTVTVAVGPVWIERQVETVQPGYAGSPVFVRDAEGDVFSVPLDAGDRRADQ